MTSLTLPTIERARADLEANIAKMVWGTRVRVSIAIFEDDGGPELTELVRQAMDTGWFFRFLGVNMGHSVRASSADSLGATTLFLNTVPEGVTITPPTVEASPVEPEEVPF